jgi:hypothetical protein
MILSVSNHTNQRSSLSVMRGLAEKNYVDGNKVESELSVALSYNYSRELEPIRLEIKQGNFAEQ